MKIQLALGLALGAASCTATIEQGPSPSEPPATTAQPASPDPQPAPTSTATVAPLPQQVGTGAVVPKACTKMGCTDMLSLVLAPKKPLGPGKYVIEVSAGDKKGTCEVKMPFPKCGTPATRCEGTLPLFAAEQGCDGPVDKMSFSPIRIGEAPAALDVVVKKNGATVMKETVKPGYKKVEPNGAECPPVCQQAEVTVAEK